MASRLELQAIVDGWNENRFTPEPPLNQFQTRILRQISSRGIAPTGFASVDEVSWKLQKAKDLAERSPSLVELVDGAYRVTMVGYEALVPERKILKGILGAFRWVPKSEYCVNVGWVIGLLDLPTQIASSYFSRLADKNIVTLKLVDGEYKEASLTPLGVELMNYVIDQAAEGRQGGQD